MNSSTTGHDELAVTAATLPQQRVFDGQLFPLVLQCRTPGAALADVQRWVNAHRHELDAQAAAHGAILFRGFPLTTGQDFDAFIAAFEYQTFPYDKSLSNAVRVNVTPRVFTANEAPPSVRIYLHHEMAQTPMYPSKLLFFCQTAADRGGATPLCRSDVLLQRLRQACPQFVRDCESKGLRYTLVMPGDADAQSGMGRSWKSTFGVDSRDLAEERLRRLGYDWHWLDDGCLKTITPVLPAVRDVGPGRRSFFNQLIAAYQGWADTRNDPARAITFGDGAPLDPAAVQCAADLAEQLTVDLPWQRGDVALVDNYITMHGRRPFQGTRRVLASMVAPSAA